MKILSLFDGMACGMLAFQRADVPVERYVAYEIDKYAIQVSTHNFPMIEQRGDVFKADFTEFEGFDAVVGGSPCTYWSIAQTKNRETEAHGIGWELFQQYVRAVREAKPRFFIYENNKSMAQAIKEEISNAFGFEPIMINSALVSAQNRQRYYWVGIRNEDGTYRKAPIEQPEDLGILLKDVLDDGCVTDKDKSHAIIGSIARTTHREYFQRNQGQMVAEPVNVTEDGKSRTIKAQYYKNGIANFVTNGGYDASAVAEPVAGRIVGRRINEDGHRDDNNKDIECVQRYEVNENPGKTNCLTTVQKDNMIAEPVPKGFCLGGGTFGGDRRALTSDKAYCLLANPPSDMTPRMIEPVCLRYERTEEGKRLRKDYESGKLHHGFNEHKTLQPRTDGKTNTVSTVQKDNMYGKGQNGQLYGLNRKTKTLSAGTGQTGNGIGSSNSPKAILPYPEHDGQPIYEVKDGHISIKGKTYPIKLADGFYVIRKLTVSECKRLQTVPDEYDMTAISNTQAYKCLGNGWTVDVIAHLIRGAVDSTYI